MKTTAIWLANAQTEHYFTKRKQSAFESTSFLLLFDIVIRINMFICMTPANGTSIVMNIQKLSNSNFRCISIILVLVLKSENTCISMDMFFEGFFSRLRPSKNKKDTVFFVWCFLICKLVIQIFFKYTWRLIYTAKWRIIYPHYDNFRVNTVSI